MSNVEVARGYDAWKAAGKPFHPLLSFVEAMVTALEEKVWKYSLKASGETIQALRVYLADHCVAMSTDGGPEWEADRTDEIDHDPDFVGRLFGVELYLDDSVPPRTYQREVTP